MNGQYKGTIKWIWLYIGSAVAVLLFNLMPFLRSCGEILYYDYYEYMRVIDPRHWNWIVPLTAWLLLSWVACFLILDRCPRLYPRRWNIWGSMVLFGIIVYQGKTIIREIQDWYFREFVTTFDLFVQYGEVSLSLQVYGWVCIAAAAAVLAWSQADKDGRYLRRVLKFSGRCIRDFYITPDTALVTR
ncbi:MAG: hypothetical protein LBT46_15420 [Planctomycetaceae bacterium]|jgi:hypothetical protein|nr:hypothetical protein [Planctomycetaceae bacterium]